jgi:hypothetical protein
MWNRRSSIFILLAILAASIQQEPVPVKSAAPTQIFMPYIRNTIPIVVSETKLLRSRLGYAEVRGNVMNTGLQPVYDVTVQVDFFDYFGRFVISNTARTVFTPTLSLQRNPFDVGSFPEEAPGIAGYTTRIISWTRESPSEFLPLTVVSSDTINISDGVSVKALFRNDNPVPLKNVWIYAWSLGQYFPFDGRSQNKSIAPGETITYTHGIMWGEQPVFMLGIGSVDP